MKKDNMVTSNKTVKSGGMPKKGKGSATGNAQPMKTGKKCPMGKGK